MEIQIRSCQAMSCALPKSHSCRAICYCTEDVAILRTQCLLTVDKINDDSTEHCISV
jgi:hypothetical protein